MSGLALIAQALGAEVSGCDAAETPYFDELRAAGIDPQVGHDASHARRRHRSWWSRPRSPPTCPRSSPPGRVHHRGELLAAAAAMRRVIAVAGTHGKTTTTAMIAHALAACGEAVGYAVGAELPLPGGGHKPNAVWGSGEWMVVEADESDRSFLNFEPEVAVLTNVELDHHSTYASELEVRAAFAEFLATRAGRPAPSWRGRSAGVPCRRASSASSPRRRCAPATCAPPARGCGSRSSSTARTSPTVDAAGAGRAQRPERARGDRRRARGRAAIRSARRAALASLPARRPALRAEGRGRAACACSTTTRTTPPRSRRRCAAARALEPRRLVAVFQPHLYSRTAHTHDDLGRALAVADVVVVLDVYRGAGAPGGLSRA